MVQIYAKSQDEARCRRSIRGHSETTLIGLTIDGQVNVFSGTVLSVEGGSAVFPGFPLRVRIAELGDRNKFH
jgi:hypothetical protein